MGSIPYLVLNLKEIYCFSNLRGKKMKAKKGFTLVEILIVVVILGILAAIVIPQFTDASTEAKEASLKSTLQTVRSQIELYKVHHNDALPGTVDGVSFEDAMTGFTDQDGAVVARGAAGAFGPYLQSMPKNPWVTGDASSVVTIVDADPEAGDDSSGWFFNTTTGRFGANDSKTTSDDTPHAEL